MLVTLQDILNAAYPLYAVTHRLPLHVHKAVSALRRCRTGALGYSASDWQRLEFDLRQLAMAGAATRGRLTKYGQHYEVRGTLRGPSGRIANVMTIWIVRSNEETPRFITAFPGEK